MSAIGRAWMDADLEMLRDTARRFFERECVPHEARWTAQHHADRDIWNKAGVAGLLCASIPEEYGGGGGSFLHEAVICEEQTGAMVAAFSNNVHSGIVAHYLLAYGTEAQKKRWLPKCVTGEIVTAVAMTEPGTGSDLAAMTTTAKRDGDFYVINGSKMFISNGIHCDLVVVAVKTDSDPANAHQGISLVVVEAGTPGFKKGRKLKKIGMVSQDTAELFFEDCRIPVANRLGEEGAGFMMLMQKLQQERLVVAAVSQAASEKVLEDTIRYTQERKAFGKPISKFQNTQFKLVECATELEVGRAFMDKLIVEHMAGTYLVKECSMAKCWFTEMGSRVVDTCLQFFGGYGYMTEYPIARAYVDARVSRIYGGANEVMKIIARAMDR